MKTKLRSLFGYVTIACILLAIFRRLILLVLDASPDWWHCVCGPWYADLYLLGLDGCWTFNGTIDGLVDFDNEYHELHMVTLLLSLVIWTIVHIVATVFVCFVIYDLFFKPSGATAEDNE